MSVSLAERRIKVLAGLAAIQADPVAHFRFGVERIAEALARLSGPHGKSELLMRGPNVSGKSLTAAAWTVACMQKKTMLDGCPLPQWRGPVEAIQVVLDNPTQLLSIQPAYERMLGRWPHYVHFNREYYASIHVMPEGGNPEARGDLRAMDKDWSVLRFRTLEGRNVEAGARGATGIGARADIVIFDEPPPMSALRELRKAPHAGREGKILIPMTPTNRRAWGPIQEDYGDTPRRCIREVDEDRIEVRWSMDELADFVLSPAEKARLWRKYQGDPLFGKDGGARWHGDYEHTEGDTPWGDMGLRALVQMLSECRKPEIVTCRVQREDSDTPVTVDNVGVQVWKHPEAGRSYYIPIDPASGVQDRPSHLAGFHVREVGSGDLCARWAGHIAPWSLGVLAAGQAIRYNGAWIDPETNDHWGPTVVRGIESPAGGNYHRIAREKKRLRAGVWSNEVGFRATEASKRADIGEIQEWLNAYAAGQRYAATPCREVIDNLLDCRLDDDQKIVVGPGMSHGLDVVLQGRSLGRAVTRSGLATQALAKQPEHEQQHLVDMILGADRRRRGPGAHGKLIPRGR